MNKQDYDKTKHRIFTSMEERLQWLALLKKAEKKGMHIQTFKEKKMSKNTSPGLAKTQVNKWVVKPRDFVRFIYNRTVRVGVVNKITEKNLIVEVAEGFKSFSIEKIRLENPDTCIMKIRGRNIWYNGVSWIAKQNDTGTLATVGSVGASILLVDRKKGE